MRTTVVPVDSTVGRHYFALYVLFYLLYNTDLSYIVTSLLATSVPARSPIRFFPLELSVQLLLEMYTCWCTLAEFLPVSGHGSWLSPKV